MLSKTTVMLSNASAEVKTAMVGLLGGVSLFAQQLPDSWEKLTFQGALILAVIFLFRLWSHDRDTYETRLKEVNELSTEALKKNTEALNNIAQKTEEQTEYFKAVARNIIDAHLAAKKEKDPPKKLP